MPPRDDSVPNNGVDLQFIQVQVMFLLALLVEVTDVIGKGKLISQVSHCVLGTSLATRSGRKLVLAQPYHSIF